MPLLKTILFDSIIKVINDSKKNFPFDLLLKELEIPVSLQKNE